MGALDGVLGDVDPGRVHTLGDQRLDQQAASAPDVQDGAGVGDADDAVGEREEEACATPRCPRCSCRSHPGVRRCSRCWSSPPSACPRSRERPLRRAGRCAAQAIRRPRRRRLLGSPPGGGGHESSREQTRAGGPGERAALLVIAVLIALAVRDRGGSDDTALPEGPDRTVTTPAGEPDPDATAPHRTPYLSARRAWRTGLRAVQQAGAAAGALLQHPPLVGLPGVDRRRRSSRSSRTSRCCRRSTADGPHRGRRPGRRARRRGGHGRVVQPQPGPRHRAPTAPSSSAASTSCRRAGSRSCETARAEPRGLQWVLVDISGQAVRLYNTHLDARRGVVRLGRRGRSPTSCGRTRRRSILGGDLNAWPGSPTVGAMSRVLLPTPGPLRVRVAPPRVAADTRSTTCS